MKQILDVPVLMSPIAVKSDLPVPGKLAEAVRADAESMPDGWRMTFAAALFPKRGNAPGSPAEEYPEIMAPGHVARSAEYPDGGAWAVISPVPVAMLAGAEAFRTNSTSASGSDQTTVTEVEIGASGTSAEPVAALVPVLPMLWPATDPVPDQQSVQSAHQAAKDVPVLINGWAARLPMGDADPALPAAPPGQPGVQLAEGASQSVPRVTFDVPGLPDRAPTGQRNRLPQYHHDILQAAPVPDAKPDVVTNGRSLATPLPTGGPAALTVMPESVPPVWVAAAPSGRAFVVGASETMGSRPAEQTTQLAGPSLQPGAQNERAQVSSSADMVSVPGLSRSGHVDGTVDPLPGATPGGRSPAMPPSPDGDVESVSKAGPPPLEPQVKTQTVDSEGATRPDARMPTGSAVGAVPPPVRMGDVVHSIPQSGKPPGSAQPLMGRAARAVSNPQAANVPTTRPEMALQAEPNALRGEGLWEQPAVEALRVEVASARDSATTSVAGSRAPFVIPGSVQAQIARHLVEVASHNPEGQLDLVLSPEELGRVRMQLSPSDGAITVAIHAERPETNDLIRRHIDELAKEFQALGYVDIGFSFGSDGTGPSDADSDDEEIPAPAPWDGHDVGRETTERITAGTDRLDLRL